MMSAELILIIAAGLLLISVLVSKISERSGIPALLLFLAIGMAVGSDGLELIHFDNPHLAQFIGIVALNLILFSGGLDTEWKDVRPIVKHAAWLSTVGVFITALVVGIAAKELLNISLLDGLLLGAIVSSTDAAAVFSILRSKSLGLKGKLRPLLEFESGSNDPMAVFLTVAVLQLVAQPESSIAGLFGSFVLQMIFGVLFGILFGRILVFFANRIQLGFEGLYPVLTLSIVFLAYGITNLAKGNGFLAVYIAGIVAGQRDFLHRRSVIRFHDGIAWLMQITMFLTLGVLVFPSEIPPIAARGMTVVFALVFLARPVSVFLTLAPTRYSFREKLFISWVGLRGAVPIILATYPLVAGISEADVIFNIVFFVVLTSTLLQGASIPYVARWLGVDAPIGKRPTYPIEFNPIRGFKNELKEITVPADSAMIGRAIVELKLPAEFLIVLIARDGEFMMPSGGTSLCAHDTLIVLSNKESFALVESQLITT